MHNFLAVDIGATSGRVILGSCSDDQISMTELWRFPNQIVRIGKHFYWNIYSLYQNIIKGLQIVANKHIPISSIGIDTWGVDFVCVAKDGAFLNIPYAYRDPHTSDTPAQYFKEIMSKSDLYEQTGIQIMNFNTIFQLHAMKKEHSSALEAAEHLLFIPDALSYLLTGKMVTEYTIASTSQLVDPRTRVMNTVLFDAMGLDVSLFPDMVQPGQIIGGLTHEVAQVCGLPEGLPVIAVAGHDTASAVAAVPAEDENFAYLSSGTWSLMGIETDAPIINEKTYNFNFTNEGGVDGTIRVLKNITGMWLLENCIKEWRAQGLDYSYAELVSMVGEKPSFGSLIDTDDPVFANPSSMTAAIVDFCRKTGQVIPDSIAAFVSCIFESLALKYRFTLDLLRKVSEHEIKVLHVIGGGSRNSLLNQYIADSIQIPVIAGPAEATSIGNIMLQAKARGIASSVKELRRSFRDSIPTETFLPKDKELWNNAFMKFQSIINN